MKKLRYQEITELDQIKLLSRGERWTQEVWLQSLYSSELKHSDLAKLFQVEFVEFPPPQLIHFQGHCCG